METKKATDFLVKCGNPVGFNRTIMQMGAALIEDGAPDHYKMIDECYVMRVFGDPGYVVFAIKTQGYGTVVKPLEELI